MGMFTSVIHPETGHEIQFKCGWGDDCDTYRLGDTVDWRYDPDTPMGGKLLDGAYYGESFKGNKSTGHWWIVIKDHTIIAVEQVETHPDGTPDDVLIREGIFRGGCTGQQAHVEAKYKVELPPLDAWTVKAWAKKAMDEERSRRRERAWDIEDYGCTREEKAHRCMVRFIHARTKEDGILRQILPPEPVP